MKYFKNISDGYILSIGTGAGGEEITETEYNNLMVTIQNRPHAEPSWGYRLKADLTWELVAMPEPVEEEEVGA